VVTAPPAPAALPSAAAPAPIAAKAADDDDGADDADEADADASSSSDSDGPRLAPKAPRGKKARLAAKHAAKARGKGGKHVALAAHPSRRRGAVRAGAASDDGSGLDATGRGREAYKRGNERLFSGDAAGAAEAYEEAIHSNPKDPSGYRGLGLAFAQQGKKAEAVRYLKAYLRRGARDAEDRKLISERIQLLGAAP
jgi:tetratricopeptide (TPR) repeat protein